MKNIGMVSEKLNRNTLKIYQQIIGICVGESSLNSVLFFQVRIDTCTLLLKYLRFSQTQRLGRIEALRLVNLRRFLALRLLLAMCKEKQFVQ